jgi:glycosyltransferase involved in cell wall biosynthesis
MMTKIIVSVLSDLSTDQRVHKVSQTLHDMGFDVLLVGAKRTKNLSFKERAYKTKELHLFFKKGILFFAEWNIRLFFFLLFKKADLLLANDLDTLPPNYMVSKIKGSVVIYDTHEFYTETAELYNRPFVKKIWVRIENFFFPKLKYIYTVNNSVAALYKERYHKELLVVRNVPLLISPQSSNSNYFLTDTLHLPTDKKIVLLQGNGINENRGAEELVLSASLLNDAFIVVIAGGGLVIDSLKKMVAENNLQQKVYFTGVLRFEILQQFTQHAFCGLSVDKPININQQASLPNKIFDYMAAAVPVIVSNIKEVANIVTQYKAGIVIDEVTPQKIAAAVNTLAADEEMYAVYCTNTQIAIKNLNWGNEKKVIEHLFTKVISENHLAIG